MKLTLRYKILFFFLVISFSGIFITAFSIFFGVEEQFDNYIQSNREQNIELIQEEVIEQYTTNGELISDRLTNLLHQQGMTEGVFYTIYDQRGQVVADTNRSSGMMRGRGMGMHSSNEYTLKSYDLAIDDVSIGTIDVHYPLEFIGEEFAFLNSIKRNIVIAIMVTVILSIIFSLIFSKRLTNGFAKMSKAIIGLKNHQKQVQIPVEELSGEMKKLGESFNELADSISKEERLRKQFTADFAHELRTPLTTLRSHLEAYQDKIWEPTQERLQQSHNELMRLVRLVNELEKLIAAENPQIKLAKTSIHANELVTFMKNQFTRRFQERGVGLTIAPFTKEIWFKGDRDRVIQILTNIINNALQYTPTGKEVLLAVDEDSHHVTFMVKDEGKGIAEKDIPYLYERFYRGDKSRDRKTGGIGIGLSIAKALIDAHQGKITIESKERIGTTVMVYFPKS